MEDHHHYTTGNGIYAECSVLCRVPSPRHSANIPHTCRISGTLANLIRHSANPQRLIQNGASLTHTPHTNTHSSTVARLPAPPPPVRPRCRRLSPRAPRRHRPSARAAAARTAAARPPVPPAAIALQPASPPPVRPRRRPPSGCPPPPRLRPPAPCSLRCRSPWLAHNHPPRRSTPAAPVHAACADARHGRRMSTPSRPAAHRRSGTPPN
ncbi:hypothetical protein PVAP13_6KG080410 [Panicum virgatum]|uniref:Uncharacterized protein n=1 Tax=Panicum virgatum TaxID=38727 RepID=A0A8T0RA04_PANVG|nr:hypothetical protein PVAP13_6KG080410 [Panicum virgatum]